MTERFSDMPGWPAALPLKFAAGYCGLSPDRFKQRCPVKPISLGNSTRGDRWLRVRLDEWLLSLDRNEPERPAKRRMGDWLGGTDQEVRPKRRMGDRLGGGRDG